LRSAAFSHSEFPPQRIGRALVELMLEIGDDLLGIG
jgi:hypothetical protein